MLTQRFRWPRLDGDLTPALVAHLVGYFAISLSLCTPPSPVFCQDQLLSSTYDQITEAFRKGKLAEAEQTLRSVLRSHPKEVQALGLLGVVLDAQNRYEEAERSYTQSLELAPNSAALWNNLGNHYLARGMVDRAEQTFHRVLSIDPRHANANLQLAKIRVEAKQGAEAFRYLDQLPSAERLLPAVQILRARAFYQSGQKEAAENLLAQLQEGNPGDPRLIFSIGMVYVQQEQFHAAEKAFSRALEAAPTNFDILYNLAVAATRAQHLDRAEEVFKVALSQKPDDADCLYGLARVYVQREQDYLAISLLLQAQRLAPARIDVPLLLAQLTEKLGFLGDTALAYDQYLKLRPGDDVARRERGFALCRSGKVKEGLLDLEWYVEKHPNDAQGFYALGVVRSTEQPQQALEDISRALQLDASHLPAHYVRAVINLQDGKAAESIGDLRFVLEHEPHNIRALTQLSQAYLFLDQPQEACNLLQPAVDLSPQDPTVLFLYSRALRRVGRKEEAKTAQARFSQLEATQPGKKPSTGLFDYLNLSPTRRQAQYVDQLKSSLAVSPKDPGLRLRLGKALLQQNLMAEAIEVFKQMGELTTDPVLLADAGKALLDFEQYPPAAELLKLATKANPSASEYRLDCAMALFHSEGPAAALAELERIPAKQRQGDYYLLRAQILDGLGRPDEAAEALNRGFQAAPTRSDLYYQGALFLLKYNQYEQAQTFIEQALQVVPEVPELQLAEAITLEFLKKPEEAKKLLLKMQSRWPEWGLPYLIHGIILEIHLFSEEAKVALNNAIMLGVNDSIAYYYLALAISHTNAEDTEGIQRALDQAIQLNPADPYIRSLAGKNAMARRKYAVALEHLSAAVRQKPDMVEAHYALSATYRALGDQEKSSAELQEAQRLERDNPSTDPDTTLVRDLLFTVQKP